MLIGWTWRTVLAAAVVGLSLGVCPCPKSGCTLAATQRSESPAEKSSCGGCKDGPASDAPDQAPCHSHKDGRTCKIVVPTEAQTATVILPPLDRSSFELPLLTALHTEPMIAPLRDAFAVDRSAPPSPALSLRAQHTLLLI